MLFTKCILSEPSAEDGVRISVMSRHTLSDGITCDPRIDGKFHFHLSIFGPSPRLIGDHYKRNLSWKEFARRYRKEMREEPKVSFVKFLARVAISVNTTLLCIEEDACFCHRKLLAKECKKYEPSLQVKHR